MEIRYQLIDESVGAPIRGHSDDAAFDLLARVPVTIEPGKWAAIPTGLILEIPEGYAGLIWDKSGLSTKFALKVLGGVVDAGYRGEIMAGMINLGTEVYEFKKGEKVAQMIIQKIENPTFIKTESLSETSRGSDGFGSTGK